MRSITIFIFCIFLSGCAASGSIQLASPNTPAIDSAKSGAVVANASSPSNADSAESLKKAVITQLVSKKLFKTVSDDNGADFLIKIEVTYVSEVSQGARIMFGALAGQAEIHASVEVIDKKTDSSIGIMVAKGTSSGGHVFAGTTQEAIDQAASQVVDFLLLNRKI